jgi:Trk K+ transport system NAD-binding subunit
LADVLEVAKANAGFLERRATGPWARLRARLPSNDKRSAKPKDLVVTLGRWTIVAATLVGILWLVLLWRADKGGAWSTLYHVVTTAFGEPLRATSQRWDVRAIIAAIMLTGAGLLGLLVSWLTAVVTADRLEHRSERKASRQQGHVIVYGLRTVGYRVVRLLKQLKFKVTVIETTGSRFVGLGKELDIPLLSGPNLGANLERARIDRARAFIACMDTAADNVNACLRAKKLNTDVQTISRVLRDVDEDAYLTYGVDLSISTPRVAAPAFVAAANDPRALRLFQVGDLDYIAMQYRVKEDDGASAKDWAAQGIRILAIAKGDRTEVPPIDIDEVVRKLKVGDEPLIAGPREAMESVVLEADELGQVIGHAARDTLWHQLQQGPLKNMSTWIAWRNALRRAGRTI